MGMYTLPYLKWITSKGLLYSTGNSAPPSAITCLHGAWVMWLSWCLMLCLLGPRILHRSVSWRESGLASQPEPPRPQHSSRPIVEGRMPAARLPATQTQREL